MLYVSVPYEWMKFHNFQAAKYQSVWPENHSLSGPDEFLDITTENDTQIL
tara:strand:+ start:1002 stop:1151 length:150 start_codon:yes stop_codon:yes gene_type:complete